MTGVLLLPVPVCVHDGESLEQLALPLEHRLKGGDHQRLAEPARTREEEHLLALRRGETMEPRGLVNVHVAPAADFAEVVGIFVYRLHCAHYTKNIRRMPYNLQQTGNAGRISVFHRAPFVMKTT